MVILIALLLFCTVLIDGTHFNGGTIRWEPVDPYDNSSTVEINIIQTYAWTYPKIDCKTDVPLSSGFTSQNNGLICVTDCSTDGGYSNRPVSILTDCVSISVPLSMMTSQRTVNITLNATAHFYVSYVGSAWRALNDAGVTGLQWSITSFIDLRIRDDGFINTPPVASVVSPQYTIVNKPTQIKIPVSDVNAGDDVRCRWSTYTFGNRRKRSNENVVYTREKRGKWKPPTPPADPCTQCGSTCWRYCPCNCPICSGTTCTGWYCQYRNGCPVTTTVAGATTPTTTVETPGTLASTVSYPRRQAIDECGGICYPNSVPTGTTLSNCTLSFIGLKPDTWYGVAIQVEDFINTTSTTPMSSVPVQFLIYVMPEPACPAAPDIVRLSGCLEVTVNVSMSFNVSVINNCNPDISDLADLIVTNDLDGIQTDILTISSTNASMGYMTFTWTPDATQIGPQRLCLTAFTDQHVQSSEYCVTFTVIKSTALCIPTTTTTSTRTSTTSKTTTTSTSTSTTSTTATTSTSTSTTSTTTTTSTSTSTTSTATSATSTTTTTVTTITTKPPTNSVNWLLILGLSLLGLLLSICFCCSCYYLYCWKGGVSRRRRQKRNAREAREQMHLSSDPERMLPTTSHIDRMFGSSRSNKGRSDGRYKVLYSRKSICSIQPSSPSTSEVPSPEENHRMSVSSAVNISRVRVVRVNNAEKPIEVGNEGIGPPTDRPFTTTVRRVSKVPKLESTDENEEANPKTYPLDIPRPPRRSVGGNVSVVRVRRSSINPKPKKTMK